MALNAEINQEPAQFSFLYFVQIVTAKATVWITRTYPLRIPKTGLYLQAM
jgi:hypothetical protein